MDSSIKIEFLVSAEISYFFYLSQNLPFLKSMDKFDVNLVV